MLKTLFSICILSLGVQTLAQTQTTLITQPVVNEIHFSGQSDETGVCIALGYHSAALGSKAVATYDIGPVVTVDATGAIVGGDVVTGQNGSWVSEIICIDQESMPTLTPTLVVRPTNPGSEILFSSQSDADGVCGLEGFEKSISGTEEFSNMAVGSVVIVDNKGNVIGGDVVTPYKGQWISALICQ